MKWVYDLTGAEPIIQDVPVYDATNIANGELLQQSLADANLTLSSGSGGFATAATTTVGATIGLNALGISLESKTTADVPSISAAHSVTTGAFCYVKAIINPFAVYRAQVDCNTTSTGSAHPLTVTAAGSSQTAQFSLASSTPTGQFDGAWVYFCNSAGPNFGSLRKVATSASAGTMIADSVLLNSVTSADRVVLMHGVGHRPNGIDVDALYVANCSVTAETCVNFRVVQNWIDRGVGVERMIESAHAGGRVNLTSVQAKIAKLYQDILCSDHIYGTS